MTSVGRKMSSWYSQVMMVSECSILTAVNWPDIVHPFCDQLTAVKTVYPLTSIAVFICWAKEARASIVLDIEWVQFVSHVGCFLGPAKLWKTAELSVYCAFHKHANSKVHKPPSQLRFSLPSIIITITSNEPWNTETQNGSKSTNHKSQTMTNEKRNR